MLLGKERNLVVECVDRLDTGLTLPKMWEIAELADHTLDPIGAILLVPFLRVRCDDNLCSNVWITGSFQSPEKWQNNIFENSPGFKFFLRPKSEARWYTPGEAISAECTRYSSKINKFRKYSGPVERVIPKIKEWILEEKLFNEALQEYR